MKTPTQFFVILFLITVFISCNQKETLQTYYVAKQETPHFISIDVPTSFVEINKTELNEEQKQAYESIDKLNMLGYSLKEGSEAEYKTELEKVRAILKHEKYQELFRGGNNSDGKILVKYIGTDTAIDELIILGNANDKGFAIVRVLGDNMEPSKIMQLGSVIQNVTTEENKVKEFMNFFN